MPHCHSQAGHTPLHGAQWTGYSPKNAVPVFHQTTGGVHRHPISTPKPFWPSHGSSASLWLSHIIAQRQTLFHPEQECAISSADSCMCSCSGDTGHTHVPALQISEKGFVAWILHLSTFLPLFHSEIHAGDGG